MAKWNRDYTAHIVGGDRLIARMFLGQGWLLTEDIDKADLIQFTGGSDVTPSLYGHPKHPKTGNDEERDKRETEIFETYLDKKPMAGICRGGQFLNVMCGGELWQDVDNHAIRGQHRAIKLASDVPESILVSSTHHQMMIPAYHLCQILMVAEQSSFREIMDGDGRGGQKVYPHYHPQLPDIEALLYDDHGVLCYQPHPEYDYASRECTDTYFEFLNRIMEG